MRIVARRCPDRFISCSEHRRVGKTSTPLTNIQLTTVRWNRLIRQEHTVALAWQYFRPLLGAACVQYIRGIAGIQGETRTCMIHIGKNIHRICGGKYVCLGAVSLLWSILRSLSCRKSNRSCLAHLLCVFLALHRGMHALAKSARTWSRAVKITLQQ